MHTHKKRRFIITYTFLQEREAHFCTKFKNNLASAEEQSQFSI